MSQIRTIYSNLAAQSVTFTRENGASVTVTARDLDELPVSVNAADAPLRLVLPYSTDTEGRDGAFASLDTIGRMDWYIVAVEAGDAGERHRGECGGPGAVSGRVRGDAAVDADDGRADERRGADRLADAAGVV